MPEHYQNGIHFKAGIYPARVIAGPGHKVVFTPGAVTVDGTRRNALPLMPSQGEVEIPPGHTLAWPTSLESRGRVPDQGELSPTSFVVADSALVGRPYKRWFWRTFPTLPSHP